MKKSRLALTLSLLLCSGFLFAQNKIVFSDAKASAGDQPAWKQPSFDDSGWPTINLNRDWDSQGFGNVDGFGYYRIRFTLPSSLLKNAYWKDSLIFTMGKIDDADETYLNGKLIGKSGGFPTDAGGYQSAWNTERVYKIASNDPALQWDKENVIAVRIYDGDGLGGMFEGFPTVRMMDLMDGLTVKTVFEKDKLGHLCAISLHNGHALPVAGTLEVVLYDTEAEQAVKTFSQKIKFTNAKPFVQKFPYANNKRFAVKVNFTEEKTKLTLKDNIIVPYILTPKAPESPRINGATVFGVRPGSPFLFKIPASGVKPMKYAVDNLPAGLQVDANTGIITGVLQKEGEYKMTFLAENSKGKDSRAFTVKVGNLLALTPPMGWNSWNCWGLSVSDEKVRSSAKALIDKGLIDYGWTYINIDDAWEAATRNADGSLTPNNKFPDMKGLGDWLHSQGLRFGIYSSPGPLTCGKYLGSYQHERQDADSYAAWGIDYLKYDWCDYGRIYDQEADHSLAAHLKPYQVMERALRAQKRDIVYSLCQYGMRDVWQWGPAVDGNLWRTTGDIVDTWASLKDIGFDRQAPLAEFAKPGRWNDPDMLIVGKVGWGEKLHQTRLTYDEQYTHLSLWSLQAAPLLIGCDISQLDDFTLSLLTNAELIAINQDPLGKQARRLADKDGTQVWVKQLADGTQALGIFNLGTDDKQETVSWSSLGLPSTVAVRDVWRQQDLGRIANELSVKVPAHGVVLLKVK
ncbi:MAG: putative Ig domain-containing protein [Candidatus Pseudobacter hemicellulosilyticus]|uniref:Alpha-galactosidase n=1 Tax=Candidatus Pseudobacter hemicellulosilyticus TaxID=3121375 RepID=A0AAJ5WUA8_9BACT|nr:MAG: putative Ig domain-containing protein [Pseudobacter sp.]